MRFKRPESGIAANIKHMHAFETATTEIEHGWPEKIAQLMRRLGVLGLDDDTVAQVEWIMPVIERLDSFQHLLTLTVAHDGKVIQRALLDADTNLTFASGFGIAASIW